MKDWEYDSDKVYRIFKDLTRFDYQYTAMNQKWKWTHEMFELISQNKEDLFVKQLLDKIGMQRYYEEIEWNEWDISLSWLRKVIAMAENEIKWSGRIMLSYLSKKDYSNAVSQWNVANGLRASFSDKNIPEDQVTLLKAAIIEKWYWEKSVFANGSPDTDRESWFRLIEERLQEIDPQTFNLSSTKKKYFNTLGLMDYVAYSEGKKGDPDASYIKNIFGVIGKYFKNPDDRINIINHTLDTIDNLSANPEVKTMLKVWSLAGNMDFLNFMIKDVEFTKNHNDWLQKFLDVMFLTNQELVNHWTDLAIKDLWETGRRQWIASGWPKRYWKYQGGSPYNPKNQKIVEDFQRKMPSRLSTPNWYTPKSSYSPGITMKNKQLAFLPNVAREYLKIFSELKHVKSKKLVNTYVRKYPNDFIGHLKFKWNPRPKINRIKKSLFR